MIKPGDKCWIFDQNRRFYAPGSSGLPIYREHYRETTIDGETRTSWIVGPYKFDKQTLRLRGDSPSVSRMCVTREAMEADIYCNENRWKIRDALMSADAGQLRQIAAILGMPR